MWQPRLLNFKAHQAALLSSGLFFGGVQIRQGIDTMFRRQRVIVSLKSTINPISVDNRLAFAA